MRLDEYEIEPPRPRTVLQPERLSPRANPTKYDRQNGTTIVLERPVDMRIHGVRWLLGDGFYVRHDLRDGARVRGYCLDEATNEATERWYIHRYLSTEPNVIAVKEVLQLDQYRRWATSENERYLTDVSLEALLSLVGAGAVAYVINRYDGYFAYKVIDAQGELAAISPWSQRWQDWLNRKA